MLATFSVTCHTTHNENQAGRRMARTAQRHFQGRATLQKTKVTQETVTPNDERLIGGIWPRNVAGTVEAAGWCLFIVGIPLGTTWPGLFVLVIATVIHGVTGQRRASPYHTLPSNDTALLWASLFLATTGLSALGAANKTLAFATSFAFFLMFWRITKGTAVFFRSFEPSDQPHTTTNNRGLMSPDRIAPWLLLSSIIGSVYAFYTYFGLRHARASGIGVSINGLGTISAFVALVAFAYGIQTWKHKRRLSIVAFITTSLAIAALLLTYSRGGWLGMIVSMGIFIGFQLARGEWRWRAIVVGVLVVTLAFAMLATTVPKFQHRLMSSFNVDANMDRVVIWQATVNMIKAKPWLGYGGGSFPDVYEIFRVDNRTHTMAFAHNLFLQIGMEFGLVGLGFYTLLLGTVAVRGFRVAWHGDALWRALYAGFIGILAHDMVDNITHGINVAGILWFTAGLLLHQAQKRFTKNLSAP